ncbi:MAG: hypothetical protein ACI9A7_000533 [Cyclobacteriaceae bacterium]|jgi:hypothetical protein
MKLDTSHSLKNKIPEAYHSYVTQNIDKIPSSKKGGASTDQTKQDPNSLKSRSSQKEFAMASMMAKSLRESLSPTMSEICESYVSGRLTAKFRNLTSLEDGQTGRRPMTLSKHGHLLNGFEFNSEHPYEQIFGANYFIKSGSRKGQVILHFPSFIPENTFARPDGATNFKIKARLVALSDFSFDINEDAYVAKNKDLHGKFGDFETTMLPLLKIPLEPMTAMIGIDYPEGIPEETACFLVMAISFYRYEVGKFNHLSKKSGMTIKRVY